MNRRLFNEQQLVTLRRLQADLRQSGLDLTLEQVHSARLIQASQAIEGWDAPLKDTARIILDSDSTGEVEELLTLTQRAQAQGRSSIDVLQEHFGTDKGSAS